MSAPRPSSAPRRVRWLLLCLPLLLVGAGALWLPLGGDTVEPGGAREESSPARPAERSRAVAEGPSRAEGSVAQDSRLVLPGAPGPEGEREQQRVLWEKRLARARHTLETYRESTRYPPDSRPAREQADTMAPAAPERTRPLSRDAEGVRLRLKQDKVFVAGEEVVHFTVACESETRTPLPCEVSLARAHEAEHVPGAAQLAPVLLPFVDSGQEGDARAGDGTYTARFQPSKQGFPLYAGTLRVDFTVRSGRAEGGAFFDIIYTGAPPASFTGQVREAVEEGSLQLYVGLRARKAGRYVVTGRVDDEGGMPLAYLTFNEELPAGAHEVKLTVFGRLILDEAPGFPLKLRDVEGFLLKEAGDPDREMLETLRGVVHTTREYAPGDFSPAEWQGEERQRYLDEFTKDVREAEERLDAVTRPPAP